MSNIGDMLVDVKGLKSVHDNIKSTFSTKQELTNVDNKFSEVNSARQSGNGTTYNNLKARLDADKEAVEADIGKLKADLADVTNHAVKSAEQLISDKRTTDKVPYKYRASQSGKSDRAYDMIVGGTVCFNQIVKNMRGNSTEKGLTFVNNNGTITISGTVTEAFDYNTVMLTNNTVNFKRDGSKYLLMLNKGIPFAWGVGGYGNVIPAGNRAGIWTNNSGGVWTNGLTFRVEVGHTVDIHELKASVFDLTQMFGTAIADHIYALEQATAGAGVALFRAMFADDYYPYNVGSLVSVEGLSAKEVVGFNRFDKSTVLNGYIVNDSNGDATAVPAGKITDYIPVIPKQTYYIKSDQASGAWGAWYDSDKNYISGITGYRISDNLSKIQTAPANARYMRLTCFYNNSGDLNTFCVNVSNPARNGEYEPYVKHTYPLDNSLTLRGVPILKDGKVEFDGDAYSANGAVTRRYAERAYQSGDESLANAITDGTNTVYKLSVETTETAIPYASPQIVAPYGTEEYISETVCPVGHITEYPDNLRAKIDGLPWDLSMIAPVEVTYTATRNYTVGNLLIVDNTLYKVTANIANGGVITPNTNVVATTLSEVIASLS